jgi:hypothetical protein
MRKVILSSLATVVVLALTALPVLADSGGPGPAPH